VGVAGKLPSATPPPTVEAEEPDADVDREFFPVSSSFAVLDRDLVDFLLTLLCDDLFSSSGLPAPEVFMVSPQYYA